MDEYFLLYDFAVLDTVAVGDTVTFGSQLNNVSISILGIDTIQINSVEKVRYWIFSKDDQLVDYLIEGVGGLHPLSPLLTYGFYGLCTCSYEATYASLTDTLVLSDNAVFGDISEFCLTASLSENDRVNRIKIYPNPVTGNSFIIEMIDNSQIDEIHLFDSQGKQIDIGIDFSENSNTCIISTSNLSRGIYSVEIVGDSKCYRKKLVLR
ncbi:T9SS type A sorting domain-containing protein [Brumimicrobium oceani]|uniref:Secretion system C-terminal sorting domain-containing protein n=1 Tax=Brumimicrobium oceani TaxID=2100725 RepID=A0A2U2XFV7_9FLAO|nr:T9SS type A sorting domain-containing protein [Brumimicrobium oceani]PWH86591.1 hypothetical protein DIT68_04980 [Brumimicrobium oceani]